MPRKILGRDSEGRVVDIEVESDWGSIGDGGTSSQGLPGADGKSAYQIARDHGYGGTETQWLATLKGDKGDRGDAGPKGDPGDPGADGSPGASAYELAVAAGFSGTEPEWIASLKGEKGDPGNDGLPGQDGQNGTPGSDGSDGAPGASAYEVAVAEGFSGTEAEWLASLVGPKGDKGDTGDPGTSSSLPAGVIVMWGGLLSAIPSGWALCDGQNGTPDLRSRFIKGAANGANPGTTGGAATHNHAAHDNHAFTQPTAANESAHTHAAGTLKDATSSNATKLFTSSTSGVSAATLTGSTAAGSAHTHAMSGGAVDAHSAHDSVNHEPAYYALAFIQKL